MHFQIQHTTNYGYSRAVFLDPHTLRFRPRVDGSQRVSRYQIDIQPKPQGLTEYQDAAGNAVTRAWFDGLHEHLTIQVNMSVETLRCNPFDFLIQPDNRTIPVQYSPDDWLAVNNCLERSSARDPDPVREMAEAYLESSGGQTVDFLTAITAGIYANMEVIHRETGEPWNPCSTLEKKRGACRDLAYLMVDACRSVGLAARFVSGYQQGADQQERRELHAWTEVYLPDAGWRGFDPTHGLAVADKHVVIAAAAQPALAAPVTGCVRGTDVETTLEIQLQVMTND